MVNAKTWQTAVIVIGILGGGGLIAYNLFGGEKIDIKYSINMIDAETGEAFIIDDYRTANVIMPAGRPGAQTQRALIEISKDPQSGAWRVAPNAERMFGALNVPIKAFDAHSHELSAQPTSFKKYTKD